MADGKEEDLLLVCYLNLLVIFVAPDVANAWAIPGPIPEPPPVMNIDFPAVESSGLVADIAGYGEVCHVLVKVGKAISWSTYISRL